MVLASTGVDGEPIAARHARKLVGMEPGGIHDQRGVDPLARRHDHEAGTASWLEPNHGCPWQHHAPVAIDLRRQTPDVGFRVEPPRLGGKECRRRRDVRLPLGERRTIHRFERDAIGGGGRMHGLELPFLTGCGHHQLAAAHMRHVKLPAERIQPRAPLVTQPCLQRIGRVIETGMNDATVVRGRLLTHAGMTLEDTHGFTAPGKGQRARQAHDATADDHDHGDILNGPRAFLPLRECDIFLG